MLGDRKWARPGRMGAVCDAWVLGLLAAHARKNKSDTTFLAELGEAVEFAAAYACHRLHGAITPWRRP